MSVQFIECIQLETDLPDVVLVVALTQFGEQFSEGLARVLFRNYEDRLCWTSRLLGDWGYFIEKS